MSAPHGHAPFRTSLDGIRRARAAYLCLACRATLETKRCPECQADHGVYFPSRIERRRAAELLLLQDGGKISALKFHPRFNLIADGHTVTTYTADFQYRDNEKRKTVVEDVKPKNFMTNLAKLKIAWFNALHAKYGVQVTIIAIGR